MLAPVTRDTERLEVAGIEALRIGQAVKGDDVIDFHGPRDAPMVGTPRTQLVLRLLHEPRPQAYPLLVIASCNPAALPLFSGPGMGCTPALGDEGTAPTFGTGAERGTGHQRIKARTVARSSTHHRRICAARSSAGWTLFQAFACPCHLSDTPSKACATVASKSSPGAGTTVRTQRDLDAKATDR